MLTSLEQTVLQMLLAGEHPVLDSLRRQLQTCEVTSREFTGVGFFTTFKVTSDSDRLTALQTLRIDDVYAQLTGLEHEAGFILFVDDGKLAELECFIVDARWPENAELVEAYYMAPTVPGHVFLQRVDVRDTSFLEGAGAP